MPFEMTGRSGAAHIGGVLSVAVIVAVLYCNILKYKINDVTGLIGTI
jgi:transketolase N-terminal domain/subunit